MTPRVSQGILALSSVRGLQKRRVTSIHHLLPQPLYRGQAQETPSHSPGIYMPPPLPACSGLWKPSTPGVSPAHLLHQRFLVAPKPAKCLHPAVTLSSWSECLACGLVGTHVERDALLNSGSEALIFPEGFGQSGFPRTRLPASFEAGSSLDLRKGQVLRDSLLVTLMSGSMCSSSTWSC